MSDQAKIYREYQEQQRAQLYARKGGWSSFTSIASSGAIFNPFSLGLRSYERLNWARIRVQTNWEGAKEVVSERVERARGAAKDMLNKAHSFSGQVTQSP